MAWTIWRRTRLNALGIIILLLGVGTGDLLYWRASHNDAPTDDDVLAEQTQSKAYRSEIERNVSAFGALLADAATTLDQPRAVALMVMVVSGVAAGGCIWVASRQRD